MSEHTPLSVVESGLIFDGMTKPAYITGQKHSWPDFRFSYRPLTPRARTLARASMRNASEQDENMARLVAQQLQSISLVYPTPWPPNESLAGKTVEFSSPSFWSTHVNPSLLTIVFGILVGTHITDTDPEWGEEEREASGKDLMQMALDEGRSPGAALDEAEQERRGN